MPQGVGAAFLLCAWLAGCGLARSLGEGPKGLDADSVGTVQAPPTGSLSTAASGAAAPAAMRTQQDEAQPQVAPNQFDQTGSDNPAGLTGSEVAELMKGGPPEDMRWLYPYDETVFPGGSVAPLVMWTGNDPPDAVYLHIRSQHFEYRGVLKPSFEEALFIPTPPSQPGVNHQPSWNITREPQKQVVIPQFAWDAAVATTLGSRDPFSIEVSERVQGAVHGPVGARFVIARGAVQGSIYYNSCYAGTVSDPGAEHARIGARIMRIPPRGHAEVVSAADSCIGCHSVAANGSRLVAQRAFANTDPMERVRNPGAPADAFTYALSLPMLPQGKPDLAAGARLGIMGAYGALSPDGAVYLAASGRLDAGYLAKADELQPPDAASLLDVATGAVLTDTGIPAQVVMPMFSPDGRQLVFNDATNGGYRIAWMDYDPVRRQASGYRALVDDDPSMPMRPGWPSLLPDGHAAIFVRTDSENFTSKLTVAPNAVPATSDLYIVDAATGQVSILARAMGFASTAQAEDPMLHRALGMDLHRNHFPSVSPAAAGGYFWLFFDSVRSFGSIGPMRALWGAAIDIHPDGRYTTDPSHPPFYVPGQEFISTGHFRAFAALNRCSADGEDCRSGIECCGGACTSGVCSRPRQSDCASREERCLQTADCCDDADLCINGFCSLVELL